MKSDKTTLSASNRRVIRTPNKLISPKEASRILCVTPGTLSVWRSTGRYSLPYIRCGRLIRYKLSDVLSFIENRTQTSTKGYKNGK